MPEKQAINSFSYWNRRFTDDWESMGGPQQSRFFTRLAIENLPSWLIEQINHESLTVADWGCAEGDGADVWAAYVDSRQIVGVDFSIEAIKKAKSNYPTISFINENWLDQNKHNAKKYDIVYSSNTLEHFHRPFEVLESLSRRSKKAIVLALPYRELDRIAEHFYSFLPDNVPLVLSNGFRLVWSKVVDCREIPNTSWQGEQIFLLYAAVPWIDFLKLKLHQCEIGSVDTDSKFSKLNQELIERISQIEELNKSLIGRDENIGALKVGYEEKQNHINELSMTLSKRNCEIEKLENQISNKISQMEELAALLEKRNFDLANSKGLQSAQRKELNALQRRLKNREVEVERLRESLLDKELKFAEFNDLIIAHKKNLSDTNISLKIQAVELDRLRKSMADKDVEIAEFNGLMLEQKKNLEDANVRLKNRDIEVERLQKYLADKDSENAAIRDVMIEQQRNLVETNMRLSERDKCLDNLTRAINDRDVENSELNLLVKELERVVQSTQHSLEDKDELIKSLHGKVHKHDRKILDFHQLLVVREENIGALEKLNIEKKQKIEELQESISGYHQKVNDLNVSLDESSGNVKKYRNELNYCHQQLTALDAEAATLFRRLEQVVQSRSWSLTRPMRATARLVRYGHLDEAGKFGISQLARWGARKLPISLKYKTKIRDKLIGGRGQTDKLLLESEKSISISTEATDSRELALPSMPMRPECCGLIPGLVSVVLPVYNQAELLEESVESVLSQTYENFELIIVNDGSKDGVETVLQKYLGHSKIQVYTQQNQKLPKALSNGFSFAKGEYWTWTSADNIMEPRMLECLVNGLNSRPDLAMVYADYYAIDDRGEILRDPSWRSHNRPNILSGEIRLPRNTNTLNTVQDNFIGPCFMYRGWVGKVLGDYDPQLGVEDYDYWMRINTLFSIEHLGTEDLLYHYRVHDNTLSAQAAEHKILEKVSKLMEYDRKRIDFYTKKFVVVADQYGSSWLTRFGLDQTSIVLINKYSELADDNLDENIDCIVLSNQSLVDCVEFLSGDSRPIAVIFGEEEMPPLSAQAIFNLKNCIAFVEDERTAQRINILGNCPVIDGCANSTFAALKAFSKNSRFFYGNKAFDEVKRQAPSPLIRQMGDHILLQVDSFTQGGMENVVIDLSLSLEESGYRVTILNLGEQGDAVKKAREFGLRVECIKFESSVDYIVWLKRENISLVNGHYCIFGAPACAELGIPFYETIHNSYVWFDPAAISAYQKADPYIDQYICVSKSAAYYADHALGLNPAKLKVIPNGINPRNIDAANFVANRKQLRQEWKVAEDAPVFLNVASIMGVKAQLPLVKAFRKVVDMQPAALLILLGATMEPAYYEDIKEAIRKFDLKSNVILSGYRRDVASHYHGADIFVLPSYWEGWSLSLGEAVANGLPCVVTGVGAAYEFEHLSNVQIVQPPFGNITEINYSNLASFVYGENKNFEEELSKHMIHSLTHSRNSECSHFADQLDREHAYNAYAHIFASAIAKESIWADSLSWEKTEMPVSLLAKR